MSGLPFHDLPSAGPIRRPPPDTGNERVERAGRLARRRLPDPAQQSELWLLFSGLWWLFALPAFGLIACIWWGLYASWWALPALPLWIWIIWRNVRSKGSWRHRLERRQRIREQLPR